MEFAKVSVDDGYITLEFDGIDGSPLALTVSEAQKLKVALQKGIDEANKDGFFDTKVFFNGEEIK